MAKLMKSHQHFIKLSFDSQYHAAAWGYINSCINQWDDEDWIFVFNNLPLDEKLIVKYVRHYKMFLHHMANFSEKSTNDAFYKIGNPIYAHIDKVIEYHKKAALEKYYMKCVAKAC